MIILPVPIDGSGDVGSLESNLVALAILVPFFAVMAVVVWHTDKRMNHGNNMGVRFKQLIQRKRRARQRTKKTEKVG